ncbi:MAG TPA: AmmeMemoRadiSam system protein A, partial [Deltaproteobacteria bacterium]|nr:AmmeMemoRadiSam system protein A [Deltaproteobacteria bacterium]
GYLLKLARMTIAERLGVHCGEPVSGHSDGEGVLMEKAPTFVTLTEQGRLRGCIGSLEAREPIVESIRRNALNAAFRDPRFPPVRPDELDRITIEVSVLSEPRHLDYEGPGDLLSKLTPGVDGVIISKGYHSATFLPQVWEQLPDKEEFLTHLCMKAGLPGDEWRKGDLDVMTYRVQSLEEED